MNIRILLTSILAAAVAASCAASTAARHRPAFPLPASKKDCSTCHVIDGKGAVAGIRKRPSELCLDCHRDRIAPSEHRIGIAPMKTVKGLPLQEGAMTCVTCHDPHKNDFGALLRMPQTDLCLSCHPL